MVLCPPQLGASPGQVLICTPAHALVIIELQMSDRVAGFRSIVVYP